MQKIASNLLNHSADYHPFGMMQPGRSYSSNSYRYGFQGQEKDDEVKGSGNSYTAEFWQYDSRVARRWNVDPIPKAHESPYAAFASNPILFIDVNGADTTIYANPNNYDLGSLEGRDDFVTFKWDKTMMAVNGSAAQYYANKLTIRFFSGSVDYPSGWYPKGEYQFAALDYESGQVMPHAKWHEFGMRRINEQGEDAGSGESWVEVDQEGYLTGKKGLNPFYFEVPWYVGGPKGSAGRAYALSNGMRLAGNLMFRSQGLAKAYLKRIIMKLPKGAKPEKQWKVTSDITKKGVDASQGFVYTSNVTHVGQFQLYKTKDGYRVLVQHSNDGKLHYHIGKANEGIHFKNANEAAKWFQENKYVKEIVNHAWYGK